MSHSDSDSDSLDEEFESADEDVKGEDIDIAELGLDDDENDTLNSQPAQSDINLKVNEQLSTTPNNVLVENKSFESTHTETKIETTNSAKTEPETKHPEIKDQPEETKPTTIENKIEENLDIVEGDDEIDQLLEELNVQDIQHNNIELSASQTKEQVKVSQDKIETKSGWDDTELSDLDDEELVSNVPVNQHTEQVKSESKNDLNKSVETNKEETKSKPSGWSWSSFGSIVSNATSSVANVASQLGTGLNTVLETVEQTIGAPDPVQLAIQAKNTKKELEEQNEQEKQNTENKEANDFNDWNNDDQEWFTINSIASKVNLFISVILL